MLFARPWRPLANPGFKRGKDDTFVFIELPHIQDRLHKAASEEEVLVVQKSTIDGASLIVYTTLYDVSEDSSGHSLTFQSSVLLPEWGKNREITQHITNCPGAWQCT